jgi:hypothetical protein
VRARGGEGVLGDSAAMAICVWIKTKLKHSLLDPITNESITNCSDCSLNVDAIKKLRNHKC